MTRPQPQTTSDLVRNQARDIALLQRRGRGGDLGMSGGFRTATLDPDYFGPGPARVAFTGTETLIGPFAWMGKYEPAQSRVVNLMRINGRWMIAGHAHARGLGGWERVALLANWRTYSRDVVDGDWVDPARATLLPSGIVVLSGLISGGTGGADTVLGQLPVGMRPDYDLLFPTNNGDVARAIKILANGQIQTSGSGTTSGFLSLEGIAFPAAGVATWTTVGAVGSGSAFANSWVDYGVAAWGPTRFWKDPFGMTWFGGLVKNGSTTDNTNIFTLPATHRAYAEHHIVAVSNETYGAVGARTTDGINVKLGSSNVYISLAGVTVLTSDATTAMNWQSLEFVNGWGVHAGAYPTPGIVRREDGLCVTRGMISGGTIGAAAFFLEKEYRTDGHTLQAAMSNSARGRIDRYGAEFQAWQGNNTWFALDSIKWYPG